MRFMFSLISQYTQCTRLWLKRYPSRRILSKRFQKPQRGRLAVTSLIASTTSQSSSNRSTLGRYDTVRYRPTKRQALALDRRYSVTLTATAACIASGVTTFGTARPWSPYSPTPTPHTSSLTDYFRLPVHEPAWVNWRKRPHTCSSTGNTRHYWSRVSYKPRQPANQHHPRPRWQQSDFLWPSTSSSLTPIGTEVSIFALLLKKRSLRPLSGCQ